jgi:hypothetical protein
MKTERGIAHGGELIEAAPDARRGCFRNCFAFINHWYRPQKARVRRPSQQRARLFAERAGFPFMGLDCTPAATQW